MVSGENGGGRAREKRALIFQSSRLIIAFSQDYIPDSRQFAGRV